MHSTHRPHFLRSTRLHAARTLVAAAIGVVLLGEAQAAPGSIAQSPLFLASAVQSNIFLIVDDSGSMNWEVLLTRGAELAHPGDSDNVSGLDYGPDDSTERRRLCAGYNALAYNPNRTYTPWVGMDSANNVYRDQGGTSTATADTVWPNAEQNPYNSGGSTSNLSSHFYFVWNDSNADGVYQNGECPTPSGVDTVAECRALGTSVCQPVTDLSAAGRINYANWYSYYRKREYVAKRAMSEIISESTARIGLATLWNNNNVRTPIRDVDDITTPVNPTAQTNKNTLLRNLFRVDSNNGTPLRTALQNAGTYYESGLASWGADWSSSPILPEAQGGACQQNFTILMSDGYWNSDTGGSIAANNADADGAGPWDGGSYADTYSDTLADVAMYYYERDLSSLPDEVRRSGRDQNNAQHMVTFTVAFGVNGTLSANPTSETAPFAWPNPLDTEDEERVDDMRHAAWNGRGQFLNAGDPDQLINSLSSAIADIEARSGSAAAVSFNSTSLQNDTMIFQAVFDSNGWSGDLNAIPIDEDGRVGSTTWTAAAGSTADSNGLDERDYTLRSFYSYNGTDGIALDWANLTTAQRNDLLTNPNGSTANEATGMARLGYIKGDRACEEHGAGTCSYSDGTNTYTTKAFRDRESRLGDIVHSSPLFVGAPSTPYPDDIESAAYSSYVNSAAKNRRKVVYVGANDGILHAFDTENNGQELFAYVPNLLFSTASDTGLHYLTDSTYEHKWYVDLSATAADVYLSGWKTVLVGALRGGGKGIFALDITDPTGFNANSVLWEFTHANLGYTFSEIRIGKLNNGKWAAIFGNGYNSDPTGDGRAKLFIVYLDGSNLSSPVVLDTGAGSIVSGNCGDPSSDCNGMSSPSLADIDGDGVIDRVYAGDLHGNLWAFNISSSNPASWGPAYGSTPLARACTSASCTSGNRQPITSRPALARHKTEHGLNTVPNIMVFFGTGQYIAVNDNDTTLRQTVYGIWDDGSGGVTRADLQEQTIGTDTAAGFTVRTLSENTVNYATQRGWFIDLPTTKERVVTNASAIGDLVFFNTMIPSASLCGYGGYGWLMLATQLNGGAPTFGAVDVDGDGVIDEDDMTEMDKFAAGIRADGIPTESRFISNKRVTTDSSGGIKVDTVEAFARNTPGRTSWTPLEF